jgi:hypothetical protein
MRPLTALSTVRRLRQFIREAGIEVVHTHLYQSTLVGRLAVSRGVALVSTYHTGFHNPTSIEYSRKRLLADRLTYRRWHQLVFVSQSVRDEIAMGLRPGPNWRVIRNFVSPSSGRCIGRGPSVTCAWWRWATCASRRTTPGPRGAGPGPRSAHRARHLREGPSAGGAGRADPHEQRRRARHHDQRVTSELLAGYDAFLMTSRHEGMSLAQLEAMQTGLPSILNDVPRCARPGPRRGALLRPPLGGQPR